MAEALGTRVQIRHFPPDMQPKLTSLSHSRHAHNSGAHQRILRHRFPQLSSGFLTITGAQIPVNVCLQQEHAGQAIYLHVWHSLLHINTNPTISRLPRLLEMAESERRNLFRS
jgi:hypothetical protein